MLLAPGDPQGDLRLVRMLAQQGDRFGAIAHGLRLRDRGFMTPSLAQQLGDVLSDAGEKDAALRTYSELVEFDATSPLSRRVLGDIYMRQGWYAAAYRQYKTLTDLDKKSPVGWLRLASAAAGSGRVDEALRIERDVASGEGSPGPNDPRFFARLASAAHLAALLAEPASPSDITSPASPERGQTQKDAIARELKKLQLFSGPGALALLTWEDYDAQVELAAADEKKETLAGEATDAGAAGLYGLLLRSDAWDKQAWAVRYKSEPAPRPLHFQLARLTWDGKSFAVVLSKGEVKAGEKLATL
jgi:predicted negative regulator of RcsB-dependent stress response